MHIAIDARRIGDFGIGTYIRSLIHALAGIDQANRYTIISSPAGIAALAELPANYITAPYAREDLSAMDHLLFPAFLRRLS